MRQFARSKQESRGYKYIYNISRKHFLPLRERFSARIIVQFFNKRRENYAIVTDSDESVAFLYLYPYVYIYL